MASDPITSWQIDRGKVESVTNFILLGYKITADGDCSHEIKRCLLLGRKAMTNLDSMDIFAGKGLCSQSCGLSSSCVQMCELDHKESWAPKNQCFWTVVLEKTLESPLDCREIKPVNPKGNNPEYSLKLKLRYFSQLMQRTDSLKKTLMLGKIENKRRRGQQRMRWLDSITSSMDINLQKFWEIVEYRGAWHALVYGDAESDKNIATEQQQQQI